MDQEYKSNFPDAIVGVREQLEEEKSRINRERDRMSKLERVISSLDSIGEVSVTRTDINGDPSQRSFKPRLKIEAQCTNLGRGPVEELIKMGGTAEWSDGGYYEITHEIRFEVR